MPQHDLVLDNGSGAAFRADANNALAALGSTMKGPNAPPAPLAGMMWLDDDTPSASVWTLKLYDGADWISIATFDISANTWAPVITRLALGAGSAAAPAYSFSGDTDTGIFSAFANSLTFAVGGSQVAQVSQSAFVLDNKAGDTDVSYFARAVDASASNQRATNFFSVNESSVPVTTLRSLVSTDGSGTIELYATSAGSRASDRRVLRATIPGSGPIALVGPVNVDGKALQIQSGTEQATTSGTAIDFTGIPAGVRRVTVTLAAVSSNGSSNFQIQIGAASIDVSGYASVANAFNNTPASVTASSGFLINTTNGAGSLWTGKIELVMRSDGKWVTSGSIINEVGSVSIFGGRKDLSASLQRLRLTTVNGTDTFDGGAINILWEF